jgi:hypothetical protein
LSHKLEEILNAPANDIMDAILYGFRAQVDVKGKLAELYLYNYLRKIEDSATIQNLKWIDVDGKPDFTLVFDSKEYRIECKNVRNETYKRPTPAFKVEIQKTRNSKDGTNTRSYRRDYFDILAVCTFNQTGKWNFYFIKSSDLELVEDDPSLLKIMQRVPIKVECPWKNDILEVLSD